jgi:hypothetical protein
MVGLENTGSAIVDDPDQQLYESYACDSDRNVTGFCNRQPEDLFHRQSRETDQERRKQLVWDIDMTCRGRERGRSSSTPAARPAGILRLEA